MFSIMNELVITQAAKEDLPAILEIQKKAFLEVTEIYNVKSLPPLEQTLESLTDEFVNGDSRDITNGIGHIAI